MYTFIKAGSKILVGSGCNKMGTQIQSRQLPNNGHVHD